MEFAIAIRIAFGSQLSYVLFGVHSRLNSRVNAICLNIAERWPKRIHKYNQKTLIQSQTSYSDKTVITLSLLSRTAVQTHKIYIDLLVFNLSLTKTLAFSGHQVICIEELSSLNTSDSIAFIHNCVTKNLIYLDDYT